MTEIKITDVIARIKAVTVELPKGKRNQVSNYCDKLAVELKKRSLRKQPADKTEDAIIKCKEAVFLALCSGRHLSQLDCREFRLEDIHTAVSHLRKRAAAAGYTTQSVWFKASSGRRLKEYWYESTTTNS